MNDLVKFEIEARPAKCCAELITARRLENDVINRTKG